MRSSYIQNNFGKIFENTIFAFPPRIAVEIGVLDGYSTVNIGAGLAKGFRFKGHRGHLHAYDLWDEYPYKHGCMDKVKEELRDRNLEEYVTLYKMDAFKVHEKYEDKSVDFIHIDISNDGDIIQKMVELWTTKIRNSGLFLFEGGSKERDEIRWMKEYNKKPIRPVLDSLDIIRENYIYGSYGKYPSLTIMKKVT